MKLGIMQPYFLPYLGYFQLVAAVDKFVFLNDVNFIKRGWINRNQILKEGGDKQLFSIPLLDASQNRRIDEIELAMDPRWQRKFKATVERTYRKAPFFDVAFPMLEKLLGSTATTIDELARESVQTFSTYLGVETPFTTSSESHDNRQLVGQDRIIDICLREEATVYVNPPSGRELYRSQAFQDKGLELKFVDPQLQPYEQFNAPFVAGLSVLDATMFNAGESLKQLVTSYQLTC